MQEEEEEEKVWALVGGEMSVVYVGYKKPGDKEMVIELQFIFDDQPENPRTVELPYNDNSMKNRLVLTFD